MRVGSDGRNTGQVGNEVWRGNLGDEDSLYKKPFFRNGSWALLLNLSSVGHQEPFMVGIFFLGVKNHNLSFPRVLRLE